MLCHWTFKSSACVNVAVFSFRWLIQMQSDCQLSSAGTRTSVGNMQMRVPSPNSTVTSCLCLEEPKQTVSSTWRCHPPSTTMLPRTSGTLVWAQSQYTHTSTDCCTLQLVVSKCLIVHCLLILYVWLSVNNRNSSVLSIQLSANRPEPTSRFKWKPDLNPAVLLTDNS